MIVLVNGIGNIGTTLLNLLVEYKQELGISRILAHKNYPNPWNVEDINILKEKGVEFFSKNENSLADFSSVQNDVEYVFDCTNNGGGIANQSWYETFPSLKGASAQGSEKKFGTSFMTGVNNSLISKVKYAHIVSCNTHSIASIMSTFLKNDFDNLEEADFVIVRRSEDIGNHQRLVSANVVARHLDDELGTHHSIDVLDLFETIGTTFKVTSSDITTPSQLMHGVRFNLKFKNEISLQDHSDHLFNNPFIATSDKFDSNVIFELGRRYSFNGRLYSHAIVIANNLLVTDKGVKGWAFIPQEGNTILSTIHAFLLRMNPENEKKAMQILMHDLLRKTW